MRFARVAAWAWLACLAAAPSACPAAGPVAGFEIRVSLHRVAGIVGGEGSSDAEAPAQEAICTGQIRGGVQAGLVEVLCSVGLFVDIQPWPGHAVQSTSSEPWRYVFGPRAPLRRAALAMGAGPARDMDSGTLTALQVTNASGDGSALEILVSF